MTRVLLIDDDSFARQTLHAALDRMGFDVCSAEDGETALKLFEHQPAEVVITDMVMPGVDGLDVIGRLRREHPEVTIIAISGGGHLIKADDCLDSARKLGADRVLRKPFSLYDLKALVVELTTGVT